MPYSTAQANRVRKALSGQRGIAEKEMFGGVSFLLGGNMVVGVHGDDLIVRVEPGDTKALLQEPDAKPFTLAGRGGMAGWLLVGPDGYRKDADLRKWVDRGIAFASSLPVKSQKGKRTKG